VAIHWAYASAFTRDAPQRTARQPPLTSSVRDVASGTRTSQRRVLRRRHIAGGSGTAMSGASWWADCCLSPNDFDDGFWRSGAGHHHSLSTNARICDSSSNWGHSVPPSLNLDKRPRRLSTRALTPHPSNGTQAWRLAAAANDIAPGNTNICGAEYTIDGVAQWPWTFVAPVRTPSLSATIAQRP